jgi:branched-subunit amino acid aminotransferase/4-amino-4-deoxychorismate lyase
LTVREAELTPAQLRRADALLLTNAVTGLRAVGAFGDRSYGRNPAIERLQVAYSEAMRSCGAP